MEHKDPAIGGCLCQQLSRRYGREASTGDDRQVVALGELGGLESWPLTLFLNIENLVVGPRWDRIVRNFPRPEWDRRPGMRFMQCPPRFIVDTRQQAHLSLVHGH